MLTRTFARVRRWYASLPDPVKAAVVAGWVVFTARMAAPTFALIDDVQVWLEGNGPAPEFVTWGRLARASGTAALGAVLNFLFRLRYPGPVYQPRGELPPPRPDDRPVADPSIITTPREG